MKITLKELKKYGANKYNIKLFKALFGKDVELTYDIVIGFFPAFDIWFLVSNYLSIYNQKKYYGIIEQSFNKYLSYRRKMFDEYKYKCKGLPEIERKRYLDTYQEKVCSKKIKYEIKCAETFWDIIKDL